ncbi:hypothetical protein ES705_38641 [subsurface metagenome]
MFEGMFLLNSIFSHLWKQANSFRAPALPSGNLGLINNCFFKKRFRAWQGFICITLSPSKPKF